MRFGKEDLMLIIPVADAAPAAAPFSSNTW